MKGPRLRTTWLLLIVIAPLPCPDRAFTSWAWTVRLTCTHRLANRGPVTILWTWVWTKPFTAPAICPEKLFRRSPTRVSPRCVSAFAASLVSPCTLSREVTSVVTRSVSAFWMAGSWMSGSMLAM
jgi:hypothetical protein